MVQPFLWAVSGGPGCPISVHCVGMDNCRTPKKYGNKYFNICKVLYVPCLVLNVLAVRKWANSETRL